jgi:hypothetical protein
MDMSNGGASRSSARSPSAGRQPRAGRIGRRGFLQAAAAAAPLIACRRTVAKTAGYGQSSELDAGVAVTRLHASLTARQKAVIAFPFDDERRTRVDANWSVTSPEIGDEFFSTEQRWLIDQALRGLLSEDAYERTLRQMSDDWGGLAEYNIALYGDPASLCQWQITGRHVTLRAWGGQAKPGLGGPIVYGHGLGDPRENLFYYQTLEANRIFSTLTPDERARALLEEAPDEDSVAIQGTAGKFPGLPLRDLAPEQRAQLSGLLSTLAASFREPTANAIRTQLDLAGGASGLHLAFYKEDDLGDDGVWDLWRLEGPNFVWHFRGAPHVHAYVNMGGSNGSVLPDATG